MILSNRKLFTIDTKIYAIEQLHHLLSNCTIFNILKHGKIYLPLMKKIIVLLFQ